MSSTRFEIRLKPEPRLRRRVCIVALVAALTGGAILSQLPAGLAWRLLLVAIWLFISGHELCRWAATAARVRDLVIDGDGRVYGRGPDGRRFRLRLLAGSAVGARLAWLRFAFDDGRRYGELFGGEGSDPDWRRLQVFWGQSRTAVR